MEMHSDPPTDQRSLYLPALQHVNLGDPLGQPSPSTPPSARFSVQSTSQLSSSIKLLSKRPSTATLSHTPEPLLPAYRPLPPSGLDESVREGRSGLAESLSTDRPSAWSWESALGEGVAGPSTLQKPGRPNIAEYAQSHSTSQPDFHEMNGEHLDWTSFVQAYAAGKWDPRHTPNPPRGDDTRDMMSAVISEDAGGKAPSWSADVTMSASEPMSHWKRISSISSKSTLMTTPPFGSRMDTSLPLRPSLPLKIRRGQVQTDTDSSIAVKNSTSKLAMPPLPRRGSLGRSLSDSASGSPAPVEDSARNMVHEPNHDVHAAAATMRLAADGIDVRPLALPSPEVELTDPLRGHTTALPSSWNHVQSQQPGGASISTVNSVDSAKIQRKKRLNSFWEGVSDLMEGHDATGIRGSSMFEDWGQTGLPTISASPLGTPPRDETQPQQDGGSPYQDPSVSENAKSAPSPSQGPPKPVALEYFGFPHEQQIDESKSTYSILPSQSFPTSDELVPSNPTESPMEPAFYDTPVFYSGASPNISRPSLSQRTVSEPIVHTSTESSFSDLQYDNEDRPKSELLRPSLPRRIREQTEYTQRGYLIPPAPPSERERQKALYKFNIVHTAKDANFDRIALLAKLVFNAKICLISLIDADEQWFKSEFGLGRESSPREESLCGHTVLQDHEPLVILDTTQDWRFEKNPFVTNHPFARFYAGAPLRTAEGFNIGSLCIIDSEPRSEFGPRQRHTLKEFAAIVIRELELWRDKIQLRIRDRIQTSMEQFTRECLEIDTQAQNGEQGLLLSSTSMEKIYERAAQLVKRTLDVEGAVLIDASSFEEFDTQNNDGTMSVLLYPSDPKQGPQSKPLTAEGFAKMVKFFKDFPEGKISEVVLPSCIRGLMPGNIHYALTVPIFNIDKQPFALLCAYNTSAKSKPYLEGHEMSYLRAIGVIILSAVLKRRMILADKAKSLFISNISHELRTPLHGILAAAELLSSTDLSPNQSAFLSTVQACGTSLVETVNHVLDFTKLSGNTKSGGAENKIRPALVDIAQLVEEATEGCWIGHSARHSSEIGSVYSPRQEDTTPQAIQPRTHVETVVDIGHRPGGWSIICERGGIRRCLMNLLGNALKFTKDGYVHVTLRELLPSPNSPEDVIKVELGVLDSGKGISENFLKNQLFQPFSQENPLQPGTGLGLAIVNSIVRSESVNGKIDVWSAEHFGTEIRIIFEAQIASPERVSPGISGDWVKDGFAEPPSVALLGFAKSRGHKLLKQVLAGYLRDWWNFTCSTTDDQLGDILLLNEDLEYVKTLTKEQDCRRPLVFMSSARGDPRVINAIDAYREAGGFSRILFKPIGPSALRQVIQACVRVLRLGLPERLRVASGSSSGRHSPRNVADSMSRRRSHGAEPGSPPTRPSLPERSRTSNVVPSAVMSSPSISDNLRLEKRISPSDSIPTISVGTGGLLLKSSVGSMELGSSVHVLVVEDNTILRELLVKWLRSRGYSVSEAADGQTGVDLFRSCPFDVVLLDMSMPVLDGVGAATEIRKLEQGQRLRSNKIIGGAQEYLLRPSRIIALTGMSSREDKRRAFEAGVDGYLVKPVSFKTLQTMFKQFGIT